MPPKTEQVIAIEPMIEKAFLQSLQQSMLESEQHQLAIGRAPQRATLEQALAQVQMLREAQLEWRVSSPPTRLRAPSHPA